ncbi:TIGR03089 family protein, partial [Streptomyces albidoflavus]
MNAIDRTPADLLRSALAADPARPLVTFYDDATGERVELSVATFANWVAKTANLLQGDLSAEPGDRLALLLPAHWQSAVWLLACHSTGVVAEVGGDPAAADLVVSGPDTLDAARACSGERIALALRPLGGRFPHAPEGFADYAVEVPGQGDRFAPFAPVEPDEPALAVAGRELTGAELV